ncbi:MAG: SCO family protein [Pedobacter sp.]|nr:MAG: SCO family protein [Pedobacter sp.]
MKQFSIKKILILVTILAVPGFLYYLLQSQGKNRYKPLAYYGPKTVASTFHTVRGEEIPDTIYHEIKKFDAFLNQKGNQVGWGNYKGKILIFGLFYTNSGDKYSVQAANKSMQMLKSAYAKNDLIQFVSMTINPRYDTPKVLDIYADSLSATPDKWNLLTADSAKQYQFINEELLLDAHQGYTDTGIARYAYANYFILVDPQHRIRGFYEAYNQETISKLDDEIKVLIAEVLRNTKDGR